MKSIGVLFVLASLLAGCDTNIAAKADDGNAAQKADLIITNGRIVTQDERGTVARAAAVKDGQFILVGSTDDVARQRGANTRVIDLEGRTVIPGLNDSHLHPTRAGRFYNAELRWDGVPTLQRAIAMVREQAARTPRGQWVRVVGGWSPEQFAERRTPTLDELNQAAPNTPVFVLHLYSRAFLNRAGLKALGIDRTTVAPPGGRFEKGANGEPTGLLVAAPNPRILYETLAKLPSLSPEDQVNSSLVDEQTPFDGLRWAIDHAETISPRNMDRVKALGGGIAVQSRLAFAGEDFKARYPQQAASAPPVREMLKRGIPVGAGTDGTRVASYNPWIALYWLVTGRTVGGTQLASTDNRLSREEALRLYTVGSAWFSGEEALKGRIAPGQYADFAVLSADCFGVPEEEIKRIESVLTVVGGDIVYGADPFVRLAPSLPQASPAWSPVRVHGGFYRSG